ncbi:MAG: glycosyltransferase family 4 protein [Gaiellaceae bacterium]|jgi:glycosyltransferase involved in cell wall biosynthesis
MKRRLCMVVHGPYPLGEPRVAREARVANELGLDVEVLALRQRGEARKETVDGVLVRRLPIRHRRGCGLARMLVEYLGFTVLASAWLAAHPRRRCIVQIHNPPDFLAVAGLLPKLLGNRLIFDVHDLSPDIFSMRFDGQRGSRITGRLLRLSEQAATRLANQVITVHEPYRRELIARGVKPGKVSVVMNSLDETLLPDSLARVESDSFRVVYHGTITHWYGVETIVEAAARASSEITDLRVELYGDGDSLPAVRELASRHGLGNCFFASGTYLPHRDTLAAVVGASVGVIPNLANRLNRFALSSKLFEYVMLGIPVACSRLPTLEEYFGEDELLFFEPGNSADLARAFVMIAQDPAGAAQRAERARARCEGYRWQRNAELYAALLDRLY